MQKIILLVLVLGVLSVGTSSSFAQTQDTLLVTTSKKSYTEGDTILVSGVVKNYDKKSQVTLQVFDTTGNLVRIDLSQPKSDGAFQTSFSATGTFRIGGQYSIQASYDGQKATTAFDFIEVIDNTPPPPPKPVVPNFREFFDPQNGAQYYLDRYYDEPEYKSWFDFNFPNYSIEQAIEIAIPDSISNIPNDSVQNEGTNPKLPEWVRNIFIWYADERISEDELLGAIQFLLDQGILKK